MEKVVPQNNGATFLFYIENDFITFFVQSSFFMN